MDANISSDPFPRQVSGTRRNHDGNIGAVVRRTMIFAAPQLGQKRIARH
jgi:hypothetical protein